MTPGDRFPRENAFLASLRQTQWMSRDELAALTRPLLERLCRHAALQTDFYPARVASLFEGGDADRGAFLPEHWQDLPILARADIGREGARLHARETPGAAGQARELFTSGTTGRPVRLRLSELSTVASLALFARLFEMFDLDMAGSLAELASVEPGQAAAPDGAYSPEWNVVAPKADHYVLSHTSTVEECLDWLLKCRPQYLSMYPALLPALARRVRERGERLDLVAVVTGGESVREDAPELIADTFGGAIHIDAYGLRETGIIAVTCPTARHMHINAETVLVEILGADGRGAAPGEMGRVIVTPLYNYAMPLLRYDTGDLAVQGAPACACGRGLPLIERVLGRSRAVFRFADGTVRLPARINRVAEHISYLGFQLVQVEPQLVEFRYVPDPHGERDDWEGAAALLRSMTHQDAEIRFVPVDEIKRSPGGKIEDALSLVPEPPPGRA